MPKGWFNQSYNHRLAAMGVKVEKVERPNSSSYKTVASIKLDEQLGYADDVDIILILDRLLQSKGYFPNTIYMKGNELFVEDYHQEELKQVQQAFAIVKQAYDNMEKDGEMPSTDAAEVYIDNIINKKKLNKEQRKVIWDAFNAEVKGMYSEYEEYGGGWY